MTCKLCNTEKALIKKSHILPEFLFKKLFDPHHKLRKFDVIQMAKGNPRISKPSSGSYEGELLCNDCDNRILGQYETYISQVLGGHLTGNEKLNCKSIVNVHALRFVEIENLNYQKTKLFLLSILYRAHISTNPEFKNVDLGIHAEKIRDIIFNNKHTEDLEYQISIVKFPDDSEYSSFIGQLVKRDVDNSTMYSIIVNGYLVMFFLKENDISKKAQNIRLKQDDKISIIEVPNSHVEKFVLSYMGLK